MPNEGRHAAMAAGSWTYTALADRVEVDPKSVERWVNLGRTPRRATAVLAAETLGEDVHARRTGVPWRTIWAAART